MSLVPSWEGDAGVPSQPKCYFRPRSRKNSFLLPRRFCSHAKSAGNQLHVNASTRIVSESPTTP